MDTIEQLLNDAIKEALAGYEMDHDETLSSERIMESFREKVATTPFQDNAIEDIQSQVTQLLSLIRAAGNDEFCTAMAHARLEEAAMWAVKSVSA